MGQRDDDPRAEELYKQMRRDMASGDEANAARYIARGLIALEDIATSLKSIARNSANAKSILQVAEEQRPKS